MTIFYQGRQSWLQIFASIPGLVSKHWLGDEENKFMAVYISGRVKNIARLIKAGEIFSMVMNSENHVNPTSKDFGVLEAPTNITT